MIGLKLMDIIPKDQFYPSTHFLHQKAIIAARANYIAKGPEGNDAPTANDPNSNDPQQQKA